MYMWETVVLDYVTEEETVAIMVYVAVIKGIQVSSMLLNVDAWMCMDVLRIFGGCPWISRY